MLFAMCGPDGRLIIIALLGVVAFIVACVGGLVAAIYATIGLAKLAAARHNRMVANGR